MQNSKEKFPHFAVKSTFKNIFVSGFFSCNPSARLQKLRWPVMIIKLRKGQKYSNIFRTIANFDKILQKVVIKISSEHHSIVSRYYPVCLFPALNSFTGSKRSIHLEHDNKFSKNFQIKNYQKISKTRVNKIMITIPLSLETKQQLSIKPRRRLFGS